MATADRAKQARRYLDKRLAELSPASRFTPPRAGWIRGIRQALGMSARALGERLHVTGQAVQAMEANEVEGKIQLETLRRAANALGCDLVYALVPRTSLQQFVEEQAKRIAQSHVQATAATMALEDQAADIDDELVLHLARELADSGRLWRNPRQ